MSTAKNKGPRRGSHSAKARSKSLFPTVAILAVLAGAIALWVIFAVRSGSSRSSERADRPTTSKTNELVPPPSVPDSSNALAGQIPVFELTDSDKAIALVEQGNQLLAAGKNLEAVEAFRAALQLEPEAEDTQFNLAFALAKLGRTDEAVQHYREALRIFPDYAEAHNNLGNLLVKEGKLEEAIVHFKKAIEAVPDHASSHNNLGTALARQGKISEAILHFSEAIRLLPDYVEARYNLGSSYLTQGRYEEAIKQFNQVLRMKPDFHQARLALVRAHEKQMTGTPR